MAWQKEENTDLLGSSSVFVKPGRQYTTSAPTPCEARVLRRVGHLCQQATATPLGRALGTSQFKGCSLSTERRSRALLNETVRPTSSTVPAPNKGLRRSRAGPKHSVFWDMLDHEGSSRRRPQIEGMRAFLRQM